jgi:hypothetical protein
MESLQGRLSPQSLFLEARIRLRKHEALEAVLLDMIAGLPEDDFCRTAREDLQLGAGCAYEDSPELDMMELDKVEIPEHPERMLFVEQLEKACHYFFMTRPRNRHLDEVTVLRRRQEVCTAVFSYLYDEQELGHEGTLDPYEVEGLAAFIRGFSLVYAAASQATSGRNDEYTYGI